MNYSKILINIEIIIMYELRFFINILEYNYVNLIYLCKLHEPIILVMILSISFHT